MPQPVRPTPFNRIENRLAGPHSVRRLRHRGLAHLAATLLLTFLFAACIAHGPLTSGLRAQEAAKDTTKEQRDKDEQSNTTRLRQAPNSRVALVLPPSFQPAKLYSGFEDERRGVSYVIFEAPHHAYDEMAGAFTADNLASRGLTDGQKAKLDRSGDFVAMQARQSSPAGSYAKFFILFRTTDQTVLVSANVPERALETGDVKREEIDAALASAQTVPAAEIKDLYKLGYLGPFREAGRVAGTSKLYTLDGRLEPEQKGLSRPALIVAPSIDKRSILDVEQTARSLLQTLAGYRDITPGAPENVEISGMKGVALQASAIDAMSDNRIVIYQVLLVAKDGGYYRLVGLSPEADAPRLLPEMQRIAQSLVVF